MKKALLILLRVLVAAAGLAYIAWSLSWQDRVALPAGTLGPGAPETVLVVTAATDTTLTVDPPGAEPLVIQRSALGRGEDRSRLLPSIFTTLRGARWLLLGAGLLLMGPVWPLQALRWLVLMRCQGLAVSAWRAFRLTMVGLFFNFSMPGMTGGDLVKAYYAAAGSGARTGAVMSIVADRVAGLVALVLLGGCAGLALTGDPLVARITSMIWLGAGVLAVAAILYFSRRVRRWTRIGRLGDRLGPDNILRRIDAAANAYRAHPRSMAAAVGLGILVHLCNAGSIAVAGYALGIEHDPRVLLTVIPVVLLAGALPISYQGLGVMEAVALSLLQSDGLASANQILGMLLLLRIYMIIYALLGSLVLLRGDIRLHPPAAAA